jgi:hypothetical protein
MTRLTIADAREQEFLVRGRNVVTEAQDEGLIFYDDVTKVHVLPEDRSFTVQIITPDLQVEMDFPDAERVREALELFEANKVAEIDAEAPNSVRLTPIESAPVDGEPVMEHSVAAMHVTGEPDIDTAAEKMPEQIPARPDQRPRENIPDTQDTQSH